MQSVMFAESNDTKLGIEKDVDGSRSVLQCTVVKSNVCHYCTLLKAFEFEIAHQCTTMDVLFLPNPYIFK